jgi:uncharacterized protein (TIGR04255 family)
MTGIADIFPDAPRVVYRKSPLFQVIAQLRFPPLLRIESAPPADFQERIRDIFPLLERSSNPTLSNLPSEIAKVLALQAVGVNYVFRTEDGKVSLSQTPDSITLTTIDYQRWENF